MCPACDGSDLRPFYRIDRVPFQSNLLLHSREEALALPCGPLHLAHCRRCGFITNTGFDPASQDLSARYEASQAFSATYTSFAQTVARRWADRFSLSGKTVVEIGCGKGEFSTLR